MTLDDNALAPACWLALVQVSLVALLGLLAWLAIRRRSPALRSGILLTAVVGLLLVPALAHVVPTWLPLPDYFAAPAQAAPDPAPASFALKVAPSVGTEIDAVVVPKPTTKAPANPSDPALQAEGPARTARFEEAVLTLTLRGEAIPTKETQPALVPTPFPLGLILASLWLLGVAVCLARAFASLALLYRTVWSARPVAEPEWAACAASLAARYGLGPVQLRESPSVASPLTMGLFRPVILLPVGRRRWSDRERTLILAHELAHIWRRDFLAGLVTELAGCLCWFHPLVRWLVGQLRLEQEYAADACAASATGDSTDYVRCLARLALEQEQGRARLAPAFWRRRPEILRRIDMLRNNPTGIPVRLGRREAWLIAALAAVCLAIAGVGRLQSAPKDEDKPQAPADGGSITRDAQGDPLPEGAIARLGSARLQHGGEVTFVAFGADTKTLITASQDGTIRVWDLAGRKETRRFTPPKPIAPKDEKPGADEKDRARLAMQLLIGAGGPGSFCVALTPDGKTLAAAHGNAIQLWEAETGKELRQIQGPAGGLAGLLFSPDGRTLAGRAVDGGLFVWDVETGKERHHIQPPAREMGNEVQVTIGGNGGEAPGMAFMPDGKTLVAAAADIAKDKVTHSVKFWDLATGKELRKVEAPEGAGVSTVAIAPGGKLLAYATGDALHLCEADTGKEVRTVKVGDGGPASLVFSPDGKTFAVRGRNQRVRLWDAETGKEIRQIADSEPSNRGGGLFLFASGVVTPETRTLAISSDGKQIASVSGGTVRVWETATGKEVPLHDGHWRAPASVVLSPDRKTVVSWGLDRVIRRWDAATGKPLGEFPAPPRTTLATFSPDGATIALANADNTIRIHDTATGKEIQQLKGHQNGISALAFAPGGMVLASRGRGDNVVRLFDLKQGAELRQFAVTPPRPAGTGFVLVLGGGRSSPGTGPGLAFSPDGGLIIAPLSSDGDPGRTLVLFDARTGKELRKVESPQPIRSFAFAPDGRTIATENGDRTITLWEVASAKPRGQLGKAEENGQQAAGNGLELTVAVEGFTGGFSEPGGPVGVSYSPDGRTLAVRNRDRTVRVWDVNAGKEVGAFKGHTGRVETVSFSSDGAVVASGSADTTILLWDPSRAVKSLARPGVVELSAEDLDAVWKDLADEDAARASQGVQKLVAGAGAVNFLAGHAKPTPRIDPKKVSGWIADLESEEFAVRQDARKKLLEVGEQAVPALEKVLASGPQLETRKRAEELLDRLTGGTLTSEQLRTVRVVEALERMGTPEARRLLKELADGAPGTLSTREAQAALGRLGR